MRRIKKEYLLTIVEDILERNINELWIEEIGKRIAKNILTDDNDSILNVDEIKKSIDDNIKEKQLLLESLQKDYQNTINARQQDLQNAQEDYQDTINKQHQDLQDLQKDYQSNIKKHQEISLIVNEADNTLNTIKANTNSLKDLIKDVNDIVNSRLANLKTFKGVVSNNNDYNNLLKKINTLKEKNLTHPMYYTILKLVANNNNVYLYGKSGAGKNTIVKEIADVMGLDFYFANAVQEKYLLEGYVDAHGIYHTTDFRRALENGGLFFLDEFDASDPEVIIFLNAVLANGYATFPASSNNSNKEIKYNIVYAHKDFRIVAAGNTNGKGATSLYNGRQQLDAATLDRFALIEFNYNEKLEAAIFKDYDELYKTFKALRELSEKNSYYELVVSTRTATNFIKNVNNFSEIELIDMFIIKGSRYRDEILKDIENIK